ncbi:MAG: DUF3604 domain-containing protein [Panacagrimonas sp.]
MTAALLLLVGCQDKGYELAGDVGGSRACDHHTELRQPFFGDLHVHTRYSLDANTQGTVIGPHEAYRFARGERLGIQPYRADGTPLRYAQLARPLDFAAVTDHAELFGEVEICTNEALDGYLSAECLLYRSAPEQAFLLFNTAQLGVYGTPQLDGTKRVPRLPYCGLGGERCLEAAKTPWVDIQRAAEAFYDRSDQCGFTTFVAYEYSAAPLSNNLHRNVIFASEVVPELPPAYQENVAPEYLWDSLSALCHESEGCAYLTIPHNSNLSAGLMFRTQNDAGAPYDRAFAERRQANEPLAEVYQHKGDSECLNTMGAGMQDELCGFEKLPYNNFTGTQFEGAGSPPLEQDFLREALKEGLRQHATIGANPFRYGLIGSTDTHLGTPGNVLENAYPGHGGAGASARDEVPAGLTDRIENSPGGLAVIWAEENTRESLFAAMRRREVYGTSGTRPVVRFFAGAALPADLCARSDFAVEGYRSGVPMGGSLPVPAQGTAPRFAVAALRDPGVDGEASEPLQRIQIVKGWYENGSKHEAVYDVAGNADNGAAVDLSTCQTSGPGAASLCAVWQDPDFDPSQHAFWYARVLENPGCRWSQRQCLAAQVDCAVPSAVPPEFESCCDAEVPKTIQERAWTSPVWYAPP